MYLTIRDLSEHLQVSVSTIYKWTSKNQIPFFKLGGSLRFKKDEIDKWVQKYEYKDRSFYGLN